MALDPNRVGGVRGDTGTTLKDILAALSGMDAMAAVASSLARIEGSLQSIAMALGVPSDCSAGYNITQLLCMLASEVVGFDGGTPPTFPVAVCPGSDIANARGPVTFVPGRVNNLPTSYWFGELGNLAGPSLVAVPSVWNNLEGCNPVNMLMYTNPNAGAQLFSCFSVTQDAAGSEVSLARFNQATKELVLMHTISQGFTEGSYSADLGMTEGQLYCLVRTVPGGETPTSTVTRAWLIPHVQG